MKKIMLLVALMAITLVSPATGKQPAPEHKVTVCHALPGSASHAYNQIEVDIASSGYVKGGHYKPGGSLGVKHRYGGDIIPPYQYKDFYFEGQNWTKKGQKIWENGCKRPIEPPGEPSGPTPLYQVGGYVCGDPHVVFLIHNIGDVPLTVRMRFRSHRTGEVVRTKWKTISYDSGPFHGQRLWDRKAQGNTRAWLQVKGYGRALQVDVRHHSVNWIGHCTPNPWSPFTTGQAPMYTIGD